MNEKEFLKDLIAFMQQRGFVYGPEPEIYGGLAGFYTYGPLGKLLKNNVEAEIRRVYQQHKFFEVQCPIIMPRIVWEASGHLKGFIDKVIFCSKCNSSFRADHLIENLESTDDHYILKEIEKRKLKCSSCGSPFKMDVKKHNLMMKTTIGIDTEAYNRPETATTTYLPFLRYYDYFRKKFPFGVFQIGYAFRNEISPRQHLLRMREFTQAEAQIFIFESQKNNFEDFEKVKKEKLLLWTAELQKAKQKEQEFTLEEGVKKKILGSKAYAYSLYLAYKLFVSLGIDKKNIRLRQHLDDEKAFYAIDAWDLEIFTNSFGWVECCGVHDRGCYDLTQHAKFSKQDLGVFNEETKKKEIPHILEIAFGTDRPVFALLDNFYNKMNKEEGKTTFQIPIHIAPIKVAIFPLMKKPELVGIAEKVYEELTKEMVCVYDESGSIGKRYLRANSDGIPYCLTIDYDSIQKKDLTIRDRDTEAQIRVKISDLPNIIRDLVTNKIKFNEIKGEKVK